MIKKTCVILIGESDDLLNIYEYIKKYIYPPAREKCEYRGIGNLKIVLNEDEPGLSLIRQCINEYGLNSPYIYQWSEFSKDEKKNCPFFLVNVSTPLQLEGTYPEDYGTKYKIHCSSCGIHSIPEEPIKVDGSFLRKTKIALLPPVFCVEEEIKEYLEKNELSGIEFGEKIVDYNGRKIRSLYHMKVSNILPPMAKNAWLEEFVSCPICGEKAYYLKSDAIYHRNDLSNAADFNLTNENISNYMCRKLIISRNAKEILDSFQKKLAGYSPIEIID